MTIIRPAAIAGSFYDADAHQLQARVGHFLKQAVQDRQAGLYPNVQAKAVIAPHAGHIYSGGAAARAYLSLSGGPAKIKRIVLIGPCHRVAVRGIVTTGADAWTTPLGTVPIDREARATASALGCMSVNDAAHAEEHSLEVHLPFLQMLFGGFTLVPFLAGAANGDEVAQVIEALYGGEETAIVISSDLSHFHNYETARKIDSTTASAIEQFDGTDIGPEQACGRVPIAGMLKVATAHGLSVARLALINSGDTAGDKNRVVGYGSWAFSR